MSLKTENKKTNINYKNYIPIFPFLQDWKRHKSAFYLASFHKPSLNIPTPSLSTSTCTTCLHPLYITTSPCYFFPLPLTPILYRSIPFPVPYLPSSTQLQFPSLPPPLLHLSLHFPILTFTFPSLPTSYLHLSRHFPLLTFTFPFTSSSSPSPSPSFSTLTITFPFTFPSSPSPSPSPSLPPPHLHLPLHYPVTYHSFLSHHSF